MRPETGLATVLSLIAGLSLLAALSLAPPLLASSSATGLKAPVQLGQATLRFLGFEVYTATLHTEGAERFGWDQPLSLRLDYARSFSNQELLQGTRKELQRIEGTQPDLPEMLQKLATCYRPVQQGDSYVAIATDPDTVEMRLNGQRTCRVSHPDLRRRFLGIWLSPNSRSARLSAQLRGE
jgi:hypothetical protein